jgi:branched-chain amino acid transport system permease protein
VTDLAQANATSAVPESAQEAPSRAGGLLASALVVAALVSLPFWLKSYHLGLATQILIFSILAMSIDVLAGFAGRTPLCHGAIFGTATYFVIYSVNTWGLPLPVALAVGVAAATAVAAIFAVLAVRVSGVYFLLLTLALGLVIWGICLRWSQVTGGENGLRGDLRTGALADPVKFYALVVVVSLAAFAAMRRFVNSPFGLTLRGIRDSESRMASMGYNTTLHVFLAFTISGFFAGVAGAIYAVFNNYVSPSAVALAQSVQGLLMAIVGGIGTLIGSFVGSAVIILLEQFVSAYTERWQMVLGIVFIMIMLFAPEGIVGKIKAIWQSHKDKNIP